MQKILALVEGQTEESFVKNVLTHYFEPRNKCLIPVIIQTKEVKSGPNFKGGVNSYTKIRKELQHLLADTNALAITTVLDYYGLPSDFPKYELNNNCYAEVDSAEQAFLEDIKSSRFIPYLQLHEFEGILFSSPKAIASALDTSGRTERKIQAIRDQFQSPEEINNGPTTHPSMRLRKIYPTYQKRFQGNLIASRIGIEQLVAECPHFKQWIEKLSSL